jgi:glutathione S-transferase
MRVVLYQYPGSPDLPSVSPPCLKVYMALRYLGIEHEVVNLRGPGQVKRVSRTGRLPAAEIEGRLVSDSIDILDALESRHPGPGLRPEEPTQALQDRLWEHFVNDHLYFIGYYLRWVACRERTLSALFGGAPWFVRLAGRHVLARQAARRAREHGIGGQDEATVLRFIERALSMLAAGIGGGPYLQGRTAPARGDLAVASMLGQVGWRGTMPPVLDRLNRHPILCEHTARVFESCGMVRPDWLRADGGSMK